MRPIPLWLAAMEARSFSLGPPSGPSSSPPPGPDRVPEGENQVRVLDRSDFPRFLEALGELGYQIVGPTVRDGAIMLGEIAVESDLPIGWTEQQEAGRYRLVRRPDGALFGFTVGPQSWKKFLFPARTRIWTADLSSGELKVRTEDPAGERPLACLGMRACELAALSVTDRVFLGGVADPTYRARRRSLLRIAVECGSSAPTCFCASMGTGPAAESAYDLALTEVLDGGRHVFLVRVGSAEGERVLAGLPLRPAPPQESEARVRRLQRVAAQQVRAIPAAKVHDLLLQNLESPQWEEVARRCLACGNCTSVCPTCFCSTTEEVPDLSGTASERWRRWDSCFNRDFSQLHTISVRTSTASRYRQWITHKLATWHEQFGTSGCIGCGRCITWCPVGIDLTQEVRALQESVCATPSEGEKSGR
jgi:sulfhydrogenase subunit beta (sulfur reductase)